MNQDMVYCWQNLKSNNNKNNWLTHIWWYSFYDEFHPLRWNLTPRCSVGFPNNTTDLFRIHTWSHYESEDRTPVSNPRSGQSTLWPKICVCWIIQKGCQFYVIFAPPLRDDHTGCTSQKRAGLNISGPSTLGHAWLVHVHKEGQW